MFIMVIRELHRGYSEEIQVHIGGFYIALFQFSRFRLTCTRKYLPFCRVPYYSFLFETICSLEKVGLLGNK